MNRYRVTCLTPTLVGDGNRLSPIDYMVWKDQVNVLDQNRIFRLLAKGPRLDSYLAQIRRVEKLDFASWGGYAQNFAARRIAFDDSTAAAACESARAENLFIPTFATSLHGVYLPATALKGPLRTALLLPRLQEQHLKETEGRMAEDRPPRYPAVPLESAFLGGSGASRTRPLQIADSDKVAAGATRVYLLRTAVLLDRGKSLELGWRTAPRGSVEPRRVAESVPTFAEMAAPGTVFEGNWSLSEFFTKEQVTRQLRWRSAPGPEEFASAANDAAAALLALHAHYCESAGLTQVFKSIQALQQRLEAARARRGACLLCIGWATGLLSKTALLKMPHEVWKSLLQNHPLYGRPLSTSLPFPKTRRVIFSQGIPAALPGWVELNFLPGE